MTKALLRVRFRALFHSMLRQSRQKRRHGTGMTVLFILLFAYVGVVFCGMFALMFSKLAPAYHTAGLDWLYFATAGLMALGLSVFGSVFATQSQIYDAKDNGLLLSMHIPPRTILLSRVLPLMVLNGVFSLLVLGPAGVVYGTMVGYTPVGLVAFVLCCLAVIAVTSYVSLGSLTLITTLAIFYPLSGRWDLLPLALILMVIIFWTHRSNIRRLALGEEKSWRKRPDA